MVIRTPTSALLERVEQHIDRLERVLKDSEDLFAAIKRGNRDDWIRELQSRLDGYAAEVGGQAALTAMPTGPDRPEL